MKAYTMVGPYRTDFGTRTNARGVKAGGSANFADLPWYDGDINIDGSLAVYFYGGRTALLDAIRALPSSPIDYRIIGRLQLMMFQNTVKVGWGKTKQIVTITPRPDIMPPELQ